MPHYIIVKNKCSIASTLIPTAMSHHQYWLDVSLTKDTKQHCIICMSKSRRVLAHCYHKKINWI
jgi:hypothetical protein